MCCRRTRTIARLVVLTLLAAGLATQTVAPAGATEAAPVFSAQWGTGGSGDGQFNDPLAAAVDGSGNVFVADTGNHRVQKFSPAGVLLTQWGTHGTGDGQFDGPVGVAVDASGNVYVSDAGNDRVQKFSSAGVFVTQWGSEHTGSGQLDNPVGVAVDGSGNVYVADTSHYRVVKFTTAGSVVAVWSLRTDTGLPPLTPPFQPRNLAVDGSGNVYVTVPQYDRVQKFSSVGAFVSQWTTESLGVAVDGSGNVYVTDPVGHKVRKFTSAGVFLTEWGTSGVGQGQFNAPFGVAVDGAGNVYVVDTFNDRVQRFAPVAAPGMSVTHTVDQTSVSVGDTVHLQVKVTNTGNVPLTNVAITAVNAPGCEVASFSLAFGTDRTVDCSRVVTAGDLGTYSNVASVTSTEVTTPVVSNTVNVAVRPAATPSPRLATGQSYSCAIAANGSVRCWGVGIFGQLGYGDTADVGDDETPGSVGPVDLGAGRTATAVTAGRLRTCAILDDSSVRCWGWNGYGQLGYGNTDIIGDDESPGSAGPVDLGAGRTAIAISAGDMYACAVLDDGAVRCWGNSGAWLGRGSAGAVGDDETPGSVAPVDLGAGRTAVSIAAGRGHVCSVLDNGTVRCWGNNGTGQLGLANRNTIGDDETPGSVAPVNLGAGRTAVQVAAGDAHTCALLSTTGRFAVGGPPAAASWGTPPPRSSATTRPLGRSARWTWARAAPAWPPPPGASHTCAVVDDATVRPCWGSAANGRLGHANAETIGDDETPGSVGPVDLGAGRTPAMVISGSKSAHTCALLDDGSVRCWGLGDNGRLGYADTATIGDDETPGSVGPVDFAPVPRLSVVTSADETSVAAGDTVHLHVTVENTGSAALTDVTIEDPHGPDCEVSPFDLAVGEEHTVDCVHVTTAEDVPTYSERGVWSPRGRGDHPGRIEHGGGGGRGAGSVVVGGEVGGRGVGVAGSGDPLPPGGDQLGQRSVDRGGCGGHPRPRLRGRSGVRSGGGWVRDHRLRLHDDVGEHRGVPEPGVGDVRGGDDAGGVEPGRRGGGPAVSVLKTADAPAVFVGGDIGYEVSVSNLSALPLEDLVLTDPNAPGCGAELATLAPGGDVTVGCTYTTTGSDEGTYANVATVDSVDIDPVDSNRVDVDVVEPAPGLSVVKSADETAVDAGDLVHLHLAVANTGNMDLTAVTVDDPNGPDCEVASFDLAGGHGHHGGLHPQAPRPVAHADLSRTLRR